MYFYSTDRYPFYHIWAWITVEGVCFITFRWLYKYIVYTSANKTFYIRYQNMSIMNVLQNVGIYFVQVVVQVAITFYYYLARTIIRRSIHSQKQLSRGNHVTFYRHDVFTRYAIQTYIQINHFYMVFKKLQNRHYLDSIHYKLLENAVL